MFEFNGTFDMIEAHTVISSGAPLTSTRRNRAMAAENLLDETWEIYRATCAPSGKSYIGLTKSGHELRWYHHVRNARMRKRTGVLHSAIQKHGEVAFTVEVLYIASSEREAIAVERGLIAAHGTMHPNGYNLTSGGETFKGTRGLKRPVSEKHKEHLRRLAAAMKGKPRDRASVEKGRAKRIGKPGNMLGKKHSAETIEKMRVVQQERARTTVSPLLGVQFSKERVAKMQAGRAAAIAARGCGYTKGRKNPTAGEKLKKFWADPEWKAKVIAARTGKKRQRTEAQIAATLANIAKHNATRIK